MFRVIASLTSGFVQTLASDVVNDAYQLEQNEHPDEDPVVHAAHTVGRVLGLIARGGS